MLHARIASTTTSGMCGTLCGRIFLDSKSSNQILVAYIGSTNLFFFICTLCHKFDTKVQGYFRVIGIVLGD